MLQSELHVFIPSPRVHIPIRDSARLHGSYWLLQRLQPTHHMMSRYQFATMKRTAVFVNISRGSLADQDALAEALPLDTTPPQSNDRDFLL